MTICETTDFIYPMLCDVYYPIVGQNIYGQIKKDWVFDKTIATNATPVGSLQEDEVRPQFLLQFENLLLGRVRSDIRISSNGDENAITNVLVTNIRTTGGQLIYRETSGERTGRGTIYELASQEPIMGPFGAIDYYKIILRRTENQGVND
jgi:hypothetical protein